MPSEPSPAGSAVQGCLDLIRESRVMTLGTCGRPEDQICPAGAWTAPVYYIFRDNLFYFFSNPEARHILDGEGRPSGAALFKDSADPAGLRGIQMSGTIASCSPGRQAIGAALAYCRRFGLAAGSGDILNFFKQRYRAGLYRFAPHEIYYMDNKQGFGHRTRIEL